MFCKKCGRELSDDALFCAYCGSKIKKPQKGFVMTKRKTEEEPRGKKREGAIDSSGRIRSNTVRPSTVAPIPKQFLRKDTFIPQRKVPKDDEDDLYMDDVAAPDDAEGYDGEDFENEIKRRILSFVAGALLLGVMGMLFWMLCLPSGKVFCAKWGLPASASAYEQLGDQYLSDKQYRNAANAYYTALLKDPDGADYELVLHVAQTQNWIGDTEKSEQAYIMCISLDATQKEPYEALAKIYRDKGDEEKASQILQAGAEKTGDSSLLD